MFQRILTVCVGNICRSPSAEILFRAALPEPEYQISSAGVGALVGKGIEATAAALLKAHGHATDSHAARMLTRDMLHHVDLVLAMEKPHIEHILSIAPEARGKVFLLGKWQDEREIADPYRRGDAAFALAYDQIAEGVAAWAARIKR
ncbi:low molecular weight protein-tyrosine-phosphatase [Azonexus caeni]|uniref:low molecular weight protein-tyrosine-phosphatase n=1 Tax=Azonexus caeni TaxID=266126 RepID=UPI003A8C15F3